jgi:hypothetical protein
MTFLVFYAIPIFAGVAFLCSLISFLQPPVPRYLQYFSLYLFFDCSLNIIAEYMAVHRQNNNPISNLSAVTSLCFFLTLVRGFIVRPKAKRFFLYTLIILPLLFAIDIYIRKNTQVFQTITYSLGCLVVVAACIFYFWQLFQHTFYVQLVREPAFWICSGVMFYYVCSFPIYALINFITMDTQAVYVFVIILDLVNIFLYLSFVIAFLCRLKIRKSTS